MIAGDTQSPLPPDPPAATGAGEQIVFNSTGRCVEVIGGVCGADGDCARGEFCETGVCKRDQGVCVSDADCPPASICTDDPIVAASPDTDADGVPEHQHLEIGLADARPGQVTPELDFGGHDHLISRSRQKSMIARPVASLSCAGSFSTTTAFTRST